MRVLELIARCYPLFFFLILYRQMRKEDIAASEDLPEYRRDDIRTRSLGYDLPMYLALFLIIFVLVMGWQGLVSALYFVLPIVLLLSIYYVFLLVLLPLCRRFFHARDCALLWVLPSALFYCGYHLKWRPVPGWIFYIPPIALKGFLVVWVCGFVVLMAYYLLSNHRYRRQLLAAACPAEGAARAIWRAELDRAGWQSNIPLVISPEALTPVTMGLQKKHLVVVLPQRRYTVAEYRLIFRHELRHIIRQDASLKFFWCFLKAICWFNPLIWVAARKASDDMELSCDEYVLREADGATRREYAELLLDTAGDSRGFSTCLSSAAGTLRHRLRCVVAPGKRHSGLVILSAAMLILCLSKGKIAVAEGRGLLGDYLELNDYQMTKTYCLEVGDGHGHFSHYRDAAENEDVDHLIAHLLSRKVTKLPTINHLEAEDFYNSTWYEFVFCDNAETETIWITVKEGWLLVGRTGINRSMCFRLESELDWALLDAYLNGE